MRVVEFFQLTLYLSNPFKCSWFKYSVSSNMIVKFDLLGTSLKFNWRLICTVIALSKRLKRT